MAVICLLLASGGFVGAGYVNNSLADDAAAQGTVHTSPAAAPAQGAGLHSFSAQGLSTDISFANTLIGAKKPAAKQFLDLSNPNANTPHLARSVNAMRGEVPEIAPELISLARKEILAAAYQGLGRPYVWGGTSFDHGWDCSGFVQWAYRQAGVALPRTEQWLPMVETDSPQPGDLVVQNPDGPNHWSHIGIYIGKGLMISALNPSVGTILHKPGDVSSSSSYFTMPVFAEADAKAKAAAEARKKAEDNQSASAAQTATATGPKTPAPGTSAPTSGTPATVKPSPTPSGTTSPTVKPSPTPSGTTRPTGEPGTLPTETGSAKPPAQTPSSTSPTDSTAAQTPTSTKAGGGTATPNS